MGTRRQTKGKPNKRFLRMQRFDCEGVYTLDASKSNVMLLRHLSASDVIRMFFRYQMPYHQPSSYGHRGAVVGLVKLDKPTRQCGRSPCGNINEIGFSLNLC